MKKQKIIIVDDHKVFRKGLRLVLESCKAARVWAEYSSGVDFLNALKQSESCDLVFMDISMPDINGFETTKQALDINPNLKVIGMSANDDVHSVNKLLEAGAVGFLSKDADFDEIHAAVYNISAGNNYFSRNVLVKLTREAGKIGSKQKSKTLLNQLTKREIQVLKLICKGNSNHDIATKLSITERTVEKHKSNLYLKTGTENVLNLALFAIKNDMVQIAN